MRQNRKYKTSSISFVLLNEGFLWMIILPWGVRSDNRPWCPPGVAHAGYPYSLPVLLSAINELFVNVCLFFWFVCLFVWLFAYICVCLFDFCLFALLFFSLFVCSILSQSLFVRSFVFVFWHSVMIRIYCKLRIRYEAVAKLVVVKCKNST